MQIDEDGQLHGLRLWLMRVPKHFIRITNATSTRETAWDSSDDNDDCGAIYLNDSAD